MISLTKRDLQSYYWIMRNVDRLEERLLELETAATRQTTSLTHAPKSSSPANRLEALVVKIVEVQDEINRQLQKAYAIMADIERAIQTLPQREAYLVRARYIDLKSWERIAVEMNYSWRQTHYIHQNALLLLAAHDCTLLHTS